MNSLGVWMAPEVSETGEGANAARQGEVVASWAGAAEARGAEHDKAGVDLLERLIVKAPAGERSVVEVLDQDVAFGNQPEQQFATALVMEV